MSGNGKNVKEIKIILLGETGVGKSCIINRYINNTFYKETSSTLGSTFLSKEITKGNTIYNLNIWDTSGQERYHSVTNLFIKGSNIVILVYSVDSLSSFDALDYWYSSIQENLEGENYLLAVIGSKSDLVDYEVISEEQGKKYAEEKKAIFKLVSAKEFPEGINLLFNTVLDEYIQRNYSDESKNFNLKKKHPKSKKKNKFC